MLNKVASKILIKAHQWKLMLFGLCGVDFVLKSLIGK